MTLDELIAQSTNPQEFTRLCNALFTDIYGHVYQVIDGTRGDNGNDGYVGSEARMLAIYCPIKPEQRTDADYLAKIRSDLAKAAKLKVESKYAIEQWTFVTPRKLSDDIISTMRLEAAEVGIVASHVESTFLANQLYQRQYLMEAFPALQQLDISAQLAQIKEALTGRAANERKPEQRPEAAPPFPVIMDNAANDRARAISAGVPTPAAKVELRQIAFQTRDAAVEINAILALIRWFGPDDDRAELIAFAERGAQLGARLQMAGIAACCRAYKSQLLAMDFHIQFVESYFSLAMEKRIGFTLASAEEKQQLLARLRAMDEAWRAEAKLAMDLLQQITEPHDAGATLEILGATLGQLAHVHLQVGASAEANRHLGECKSLLMSAKDLYASAGDELRASNAVFNLANQIRFHGKSAEALGLVKGVIPVAEQHGDLLLLQKALWLQGAITTGSVPAYEEGEMRNWTVMAAKPE